MKLTSPIGAELGNYTRDKKLCVQVIRKNVNGNTGEKQNVAYHKDYQSIEDIWIGNFKE